MAAGVKGISLRLLLKTAAVQNTKVHDNKAASSGSDDSDKYNCNVHGSLAAYQATSLKQGGGERSESASACMAEHIHDNYVQPPKATNAPGLAPVSSLKAAQFPWPTRNGYRPDSKSIRFANLDEATRRR